MTRRKFLPLLAMVFTTGCDIKRRAQNAIASAQGYGSCLRCGDTWDRKKEQSITYVSSHIVIDGKKVRFPARGIFPLCIECFDQCDEVEVLRFCKTLWERWDREGVKFPEAALLESIREIKATKGVAA